MYSAKDVVIDFEVDGGDGSGPCSSTSSAPMTGWVHPARRLGVPDLTLGVHFDNGFFATADGGGATGGGQIYLRIPNLRGR